MSRLGSGAVRPSLLCLGLAAQALLGGCGGQVPQLRPVPLGAQAISFLGDTLWSVPMSIDDAQTHLEALTEARRRLAQGMGGVADRLLVARRTAEMGRLREAFDLYSAVLRDDPESYRARRRRGEIYLLLREPGRARAEFTEAIAQVRTHPEIKEFTEVDGGLVGTSVYFSSTLWLGITRYVQGDFADAAKVLDQAMTRASDADEVASTAVWLFFSLGRAGRTRRAAELIQAVPDTLPVLRRTAERRLLLFFKGRIGIDSLRRVAVRSHNSVEEMLDLYGLGVLVLEQGRTAEARGMFEQAMAVGSWATFSYLAAEADVARLDRAAQRR